MKKTGQKVIFKRGKYVLAAKKPAPRPRGRPAGGKLLFTKAQVDALPEKASARQVAVGLGVDCAIVAQWRNKKIRPLPHRYVKTKFINGLIVIKREELLNWLKSIGRLR